MTKAEAGRFSLERMVIKSTTTNKEVDIGPVVYSFSIYESMSSGFVYGNATVFDSTGVFYDLPLRGEETLEITYSDYYDNTRTDKFFVYSIDGIDIAKQESSEGKLLQFTLKFVSIGKFYSDKKMIRKSFTNDTYQSFVQRVFDENYADSGKSLDTVEETAGTHSLVVPNYTPEDTMHMFARRSASPTHLESNFRFYETRDKYYFTTTGNLIQKLGPVNIDNYPIEKSFAYKAIADHTPTGQNEAMQSIIDMSFNELVDTIRDRKEAAYLKDVIEIDLTNRSVTSTEYDYITKIDSYKVQSFPQNPRHDADFISKNFERNVRRYVPKDYSPIGQPATPGLREYPYYVEALTDKSASFYHYRTNQINLTVYGRNELMPGDIIKVVVPQYRHGEPDQGAPDDAERTGLYIVEYIENQFVEDIYKQKLIITKSGI